MSTGRKIGIGLAALVVLGSVSSAINKTTEPTTAKAAGTTSDETEIQIMAMDAVWPSKNPCTEYLALAESIGSSKAMDFGVGVYRKAIEEDGSTILTAGAETHLRSLLADC